MFAGVETNTLTAIFYTVAILIIYQLIKLEWREILSERKVKKD